MLLGYDAKGTKVKISKFDFIKVKKFYASKDSVDTVKRQLTGSDPICKPYI